MPSPPHGQIAWLSSMGTILDRKEIQQYIVYGRSMSLVFLSPLPLLLISFADRGSAYASYSLQLQPRHQQLISGREDLVGA